MPERIVEANGVELCTESFGEPGDRPILLLQGSGASMLWWEEGLCRMLAGRGRFVIRYDQRDTGRSTTYPPGQPGYTGVDLVADAARVLDGYEIRAAHVVGVSAGGALAQLLALGFPDRVLSLVLVSTSPAKPVSRTLPHPAQRYRRFLETARIDWTDESSVVEYLVAYARMLTGDEARFDEGAVRELVRADVERARDIAASENHGIAAQGDVWPEPLSAITAPTLVIHGTADPMFPLEHGEAVAAEIPGATLLPLEGGGHGVERADWETVVEAIAAHTAGS